MFEPFFRQPSWLEILEVWGGVLGGMRCQDGFKMTYKGGGDPNYVSKNWDDPSSRNPTYNNNNNNNNNSNNNNNNNNNIIGS